MKNPLFLFFKMTLSGLVLLLLSFSVHAGAADAQLPSIPRYTFEVKEAEYTRLCSRNKIMTVNGEFPGPTLYVQRGDIIFVDVINNSPHNVTLHWHGVIQPRNPWIDGPEYITQCPIQRGKKFSQRVEFSTEEGTLWWHAHSEWTRATVHGAIVVRPKKGSTYPFPEPEAEFPIIFGEWWKGGVFETFQQFLHSGGDPNASDAITINSQPGDLYPCSKLGTFTVDVDHGKTYLLRLINAALEDVMFFGVADHQLTVVGADGSYTKQFTTDYVTISPGQTMDVLLEAKPLPDSLRRTRYYMAANVFSSNPGPRFFKPIAATAILRYDHNPSLPDLPIPSLPILPRVNDSESTISFGRRLRSLSIPADYPVPQKVNTNIFLTLSINIQPCPTQNCQGPFGNILAASVNNVSFIHPTSMDILSAYYRNISGVYDVADIQPVPTVGSQGNDLTQVPPFAAASAARGTKVHVLEYNATVEVVLQGTNLALGVDHPIHFHGMSFYVVGIGLGSFDEVRDSKSFNLVDPPLMNTIDVPRNGWVVIRFTALNPGVWLMHCHVERHHSWGMGGVFIVKNGEGDDDSSKMLPPPPDMPPC